MASIKGLDRGQRPALIISECQNGMTNPDFGGNQRLCGHAERRGIIQKIAALARVCREIRVPVVHCTIVPRPGFEGLDPTCVLMASLRKGGKLFKGSPDAEIHPQLSPEPEDFVVERIHGVSAFHGTELESILRGVKVDTIVLTGVSTNIALPGISTEAVNRGFNVVLPEDCTAGGTTETHEMQIEYHLPLLASVTTSERVTEALRALERA